MKLQGGGFGPYGGGCPGCGGGYGHHGHGWHHDGWGWDGYCAAEVVIVAGVVTGRSTRRVDLLTLTGNTFIRTGV